MMLGARALLTVTSASTLHLLILLGAAVVGRRRCPPESNTDLFVAVVIPAHNEEHQVAAAVRSALASDYPPDRRRIIVVADNCEDRTAAIARDSGAEVWEREDRMNRGKGSALQWALARLTSEDTVDAMYVIDADCEMTTNLLGALAARLAAGADAAQAGYLVSNPEASTAAALRWAGFALFNVIRPLGRETLGLSCGLLGSGMAFSSDLMRRSPWSSFSFAEDREQHMRWVLAGARVAFAREATVFSPAQTSSTLASTQDARWESGRLTLARSLGSRLLALAWRKHDAAALDAALEPLLVPQSLLLGASAVSLAFGAMLTDRKLLRSSALTLFAQAVYVLGGLAAARAPRPVWRSLPAAGPFALRRVGRVASLGGGRGPVDWVRATREA